MIVNVSVIASVKPSKTISPMELFLLLQPYVGKTFVFTMEPTQTVNDLKLLCESALQIQASSFEDTLLEKDVVLSPELTLAAAGVDDGDNVQYRLVINA